MYGLPNGFDGSRLVGCRLVQVAFSANTVHFAFSDSASITVESSFSYMTAGDAAPPEMTHLPVRSSRVMQLVGEAIRSASASVDGTLTIVFASGQTLIIYDDTPLYEAYRLKIGQEEIIV